MTFRFRPYLVSSAAGDRSLVFRPVLTVGVSSDTEQGQWDALIDTGADECIFPDSIAEPLGLDLARATTGRISGVGGDALSAAYTGLQLELTDGTMSVRWPVIVGFVHYPRPAEEILILGHSGFLEFFTAVFDGEKRTLELLPNPRLPMSG